VPAGWRLDGASCTLEGGAATGTPTTNGVTGIAIQSGLVTTCTFTDTQLNPAMTIDKSSTTPSIDHVGQVVPYTFLVTNTGNVALTGITVTDTKVATVICPATTLAVGANMTCTGNYTVTQADLDDPDGELNNTATADSDQTGPVTDSHAIPIVRNPALSITKVATEQSFDSVGDVIHYTIVATNTGNVTLTNVTVTDPVVSGLVCTPANGSSLAPGASMTCTATHTITQADLDAGHFANTACVDDGSGGAAQACADEDVPGEQNPAIGIAKNPDSQTFQSPGTANFSITVTNTGNVTLTAVHVDDALALDCERTSGELGANATLAPGATFTYTCSQGGVTASFTNSATATGTPPQGDNVSATDTADVVVTQPPPPPPPPPVVVVTRNLTITKTDDPDPVTVGNNLTYTVIVTNQGPGGATGVTAADQLPATATFVSASSTQGTCSQASGVVTCNLGTLASGASATITIVVRPTATGTILNTVMVVANEAETNNADNTATAPTLVVGVIQPPAPTCASLTVTPRQLTVGKRTTIVARVRLSNGRPFTRARVRVVAPGITKAQLTNAQGIARITVRPTKAGIARVNVVNNPRCAVRRVGIIGVFQPPLTG
jgi:uncharacterized repeat protein (TIGR01451 family)